ncbi:putative orfan [Tupanvirus soda lake]|uniref:Orfan n=2 Tax=Tupanvirus TaxID=2094720 RepID=A0AC62AD34_9VIRU|nr:putative orfan [Tupanvirus soda lake]QKU35644.1 putative orfan [Tupanvirus soda lake]
MEAPRNIIMHHGNIIVVPDLEASIRDYVSFQVVYDNDTTIDMYDDDHPTQLKFYAYRRIVVYSLIVNIVWHGGYSFDHEEDMYNICSVLTRKRWIHNNKTQISFSRNDVISVLLAVDSGMEPMLFLRHVEDPFSVQEYQDVFKPWQVNLFSADDYNGMTASDVSCILERFDFKPVNDDVLFSHCQTSAFLPDNAYIYPDDDLDFQPHCHLYDFEPKVSRKRVRNRSSASRQMILRKRISRSRTLSRNRLAGLRQVTLLGS